MVNGTTRWYLEKSCKQTTMYPPSLCLRNIKEAKYRLVIQYVSTSYDLRNTLETATCSLERPSSTIVLGGNHPCCRERRLSWCKGVPRLPSAPCYTRSSRIPLSGVFHPRPCLFVLLCQAASVPPSSSDFRMWILSLVCLFIIHFFPWQRWKDSKFEEVTLKSMGLVVQLNHSSTFCEHPIPSHSAMLVLHSNGIHQVALRYCGCSKAIPQHLQLLRRGLYPASQLSVKTCASFQLLDLLHKLSLATKSSTYNFYRALEKLTNNTGINVPKLRY